VALLRTNDFGWHGPGFPGPCLAVSPANADSKTRVEHLNEGMAANGGSHATRPRNRDRQQQGHPPGDLNIAGFREKLHENEGLLAKRTCSGDTCE
jgi:hypothetical protein